MSDKIVLTFAAQQYGMTPEMLADHIGCAVEDVVVNKSEADDMATMQQMVEQKEVAGE